MSRSSVILVLAIVAAAAVPGAARTAPRLPVQFPHLFAFVSPSGDDANPCSAAAPCRTLDQAYRSVNPGGFVLIGNGSYPDQTIALDPAKDGVALPVTFLPAPFARPFLSRVGLGDPANGIPAPSYIALVGLHLGEAEAFTPAQHIAWIDLHAGNFYIRGVQHMLVKGGDWGPCNIDTPVNCDGNSKIDYPDGEQPNVDITIDGATFHDYRIAPFSDSHFECMFIAGGTNITVENSRFYNCEFFDIFVQNTGPMGDPGITGLTIQNDVFDTPWDGQLHKNRWSAVSFSPVDRPFRNVLIRYNSFGSITGIEYNATDDLTPATEFEYENFRIVGNLLGTANSCYPHGTTFEYNVIVDGFCGPTDVTAALGYVRDTTDPSTWDFRLGHGASGVDLLPGTDADQQLPTDIFGRRRPLSRSYDAGAVEGG